MMEKRKLLCCTCGEPVVYRATERVEFLESVAWDGDALEYSGDRQVVGGESLQAGLWCDRCGEWRCGREDEEVAEALGLRRLRLEGPCLQLEGPED